MATRAAATITMSMREVDRVKTVQAVVDRMLPVGLAAKRLGLADVNSSGCCSSTRPKAPRGLGFGQARSAEQPSVGSWGRRARAQR